MPKPARGPHLTYRPGLDGIRALAVIGVFLYHAWPHANGGPWVPGGFLGVDLFFVLSGYLITSILLIEWEHHRQINLLRFWGRRARRLFPAVVVVVLASLLLAAMFARDHLAQTRSDTFGSLFYYNNWHQIYAKGSYFAQGYPSLLRHFWSLAVEEQFYILWPLLLVPGLIFLGRRWLPVAVGVGIAASAIEMWLLYPGFGNDPSRVYYGTDTRAFLLLMGIELALLWPYVERLRRTLPLLELLGLAALGITIWLFATLQDYDPVVYQGGDLAASFCFAVLIAAVAHQRTLLGQAFGLAPLRWIGERSYGMYLWHWPIVVLTKPGVGISATGATAILLQAALTVAAAALSYRFIEQPIRTGRLQKRLAESGARAEALAAGAAAIVVLFAILYVAPSATSAQSGPPPTTTTATTTTTTHTTTTTKPPNGHKSKLLPPGPMLALGDSVMEGCKDDLRKALDYRVHVDATVGIQIDAVIQKVQRYRAKGQLPKIVIIQVGNNGPLDSDHLRWLKQSLRGVPDIVVVNDRNGTSWQDESDREITTWLKYWHIAHLADWYDHSNDNMLYPDGTHPYPWACKIYAQVIKNTLRGTQVAH